MKRKRSKDRWVRKKLAQAIVSGLLLSLSVPVWAADVNDAGNVEENQAVVAPNQLNDTFKNFANRDVLQNLVKADEEAITYVNTHPDADWKEIYDKNTRELIYSNELDDINANRANALGYTGSGIVLGMVDRTPNFEHRELSGKEYSCEGVFESGESHGTGVASITTRLY